ncbi:BA75_01670T0 [Komagataella pastoris]|uniref:Ribosome biogenesis protein YTM1 n=1 Tax=Komagataella pastoris TaxID=4922 RepID=A0A1B2J812_PICPA|nr:BA75_01670T0 [Komagataella pastoris]
MSESQEQIKIRFITRDEDESIHVSENPLYVPVSLRRYGLSEIVNHLIGHDSPIPFDFLINGTLLKTSLEEYLKSKDLSTEAFLILEYSRAVLPPDFLASFNNEDWISSVDTLGSDSKLATQPKILSGSYDGIVRIWDMSGNNEAQLAGHAGPIKDVKFISSSQLMSAGNDRQIRLWDATIPQEFQENGEAQQESISATTIAILEGHKAPVLSLALDSPTNRILSASADHSLAFWSTNPDDMNASAPLINEFAHVSSSARKRAKLAIEDSSIKRRAPLSFLEGHSSPVEGVIFDKNDSTVGYSASQDHTVKTWDLVTARCVDTRATSYSLLSITQLDKVGLIACGSSARHINLHDPRVDSNKSVVQSQLIGHTNFVVSLAPSPTNEYMFVSGSHDGTSKVWDIRANKSVFTITRESGEKKNNNKVFGVAWNKEIGIVSGGDDKKIQINRSV